MSTGGTQNDQVPHALAFIADTLALDGYSLTIESDLPRLHLSVEAGPEACADCLVGKDMFSIMVTKALDDAGLSSEAVNLEISYPADTVESPPARGGR